MRLPIVQVIEHSTMRRGVLHTTEGRCRQARKPLFQAREHRRLRRAFLDRAREGGARPEEARYQAGQAEDHHS